MRTIIFAILLVGATQAAALTTYQEKIVRFVKNHEGKEVGKGGCNHLISEIKKKFDLVGYHKFDITYSTNELIPQVEVGDYLYNNFFIDKWGQQCGSHYEMVVGKINDSTFILAGQNASWIHGVYLSKGSSLYACGGKLEVYGLAPRKGTGVSKEKRDEYRSLRRPELANR